MARAKMLGAVFFMEVNLSMSTEENEAIVRGYMTDIVNNRMVSELGRYFSDTLVFNETANLTQLTAHVAMMWAAFPDYRLSIEDQMGAGDKVTTRVSFTGTHQGSFNGISPTGKRVRFAGIAIDRIAGGKVVEMWHISNTASLLQQIGARFATQQV